MAEFEFLESLGEGAEGSVTRAQRDTGELVALKRVATRLRLPRLSHPGLAAPTDCVRIDGHWFVVMPWADGPNLAELDPRPMEQVLDLIAPVADALHYLHTRRTPVVHGDVKPDNIVLTRDRGAVLVDVSPPWPGKGTRGFRAPEVTATTEPTPASDVFSLAATIVTLATGAPPGTDESQLRVVGRGLRRALSIDPANRPAVRELLAEIAAVPSNRHDTPPAIGRADEAVAVASALTTHRLVTATGIGGIGKSHLVAAVADRLRPRFPGGVWFVRVEEAASAEVARAFGQVLQVDAWSIADRLGANAALLVLDLADRTPGDLAASVQQVIDASPSVSVLAANRDPIGVAHEAVVPLGPLAPDAAEQLAHTWGLASEAGRSGVPLAIRMDATGARAVDDAVAAGVDRLESAEREGLARLTVFAFPFTRDAAWRVARVSAGHLKAFVARGLVASVGERYRVLDLVADHVKPATAPPALRRRLQDWTRRDHAAPPDPSDLDEVLVVASAAVDAGDDAFLGSVYELLVERLRVGRLRDAYELSLRIEAEMPPESLSRRRARLFIAWVGYDEARHRLEAEAADAGDEPLLWAARSALAYNRRADGDPATTKVQRDAVAAYRAAGDAALVVRGLHALGHDLVDHRDAGSALAPLYEATDLVRTLPMPWMLAVVLDALGSALLSVGDIDRARTHLEEAIAVLASLGDRRGAAWSVASLAALEAQRGNRARAMTMRESAVADLALAGDRELCGSVMTSLAADHAEDDPARALLLIEAGVALAEDLFSNGLDEPGQGLLEQCRAAVGEAEARRIQELAKSLDLPTAAEVALAP